VHRADWTSGIIDQHLLPGQKAKGLTVRRRLERQLKQRSLELIVFNGEFV
jgi:hypothetical protein